MGSINPIEQIADTTSSTYEDVCLLGGAAIGPTVIPDAATYYGRFIVQHAGGSEGNEQFIRPVVHSDVGSIAELSELELSRDGTDDAFGVGVSDTDWVPLTSLDNNTRELRGSSLQGRIDGDTGSWASARAGLQIGWRRDE